MKNQSTGQCGPEKSNQIKSSWETETMRGNENGRVQFTLSMAEDENKALSPFSRATEKRKSQKFSSVNGFTITLRSVPKISILGAKKYVFNGN